MFKHDVILCTAYPAVGYQSKFVRILQLGIKEIRVVATAQGIYSMFTLAALVQYTSLR